MNKLAPPPPMAFRERKNLVPLPYRRVSTQPYTGPLTAVGLVDYFVGREAYRRTDFIVLGAPDGAHAVIAIRRENDDDLFSRITDVEVIALPDECVYAEDDDTDCANKSALAELAHAQGVGSDRTLIARGLYDHVNFIHRPDPVVLRVLEVSPPEPPKLYHLVRHVLSYADLPPIRVELERIELLDLCRQVSPKAYLVPCRSGGLDALSAPVYFLDERPAERQDWVLVGCERSLQFHRHYYGDEPPRVEMCPRVLAGDREELTMLKCCLLEFHIERVGNVAAVPWGTDLEMVERSLRDLMQTLSGGDDGE